RASVTDATRRRASIVGGSCPCTWWSVKAGWVRHEGGIVMDPIGRIDRATACASEKGKGDAGSDLWSPTPSWEFALRALLNHLVGGFAMRTAAANGEKAEIPQGDQFSSDPAKVYDDRRGALMSAVRADGALDHNWEMPFGSLPGSTMAQIAFMEHLTHGWD